MINACQSKRCQRYLGFSSKIGLPVCLRFRDTGCPVQYLQGTDKCPYYAPPDRGKEATDESRPTTR